MDTDETTYLVEADKQVSKQMFFNTRKSFLYNLIVFIYNSV